MLNSVGSILLAGLLGAGQTTPSKTHAFRVVYVDTTKPELAFVAAKMKERKILEGAAEMLSALKLPRTLTLKSESCGESNAWYDAQTDVITFCYELVNDFIKSAGKSEKFNLTPEQAVIGPFMFIVLHETAHAVFAVLAIPVLGREEDAADQVAAYAATQLGGDFAERMLRAAAFMYDSDSARKPGEDDFADVHGLDRQRFYNVLCLAWGSDPKRYAFAKDLGKLPDDRAEGCADEYHQVRFAVQTLIRKSGAPAAASRSPIPRE
ncbi:MAG TPA: DUF4344 domain-containing metallopeptidase, partial [Myxococcaceae bacterium]